MQQIRDAANETRQVKRLGEEIVRMHRDGSPGHVAGQCAHENDGNFFRRGLAFQDFAHGQAVEIGQQDVEQDQVRLHLPRLAQGVDAVIGDDQVVAVPRELVLQQLDEIILIIHDQDTRHHANTISQNRAKHKDGRVKTV
jgi:hypothetical protein